MWTLMHAPEGGLLGWLPWKTQPTFSGYQFVTFALTMGATAKVIARPTGIAADRVRLSPNN